MKHRIALSLSVFALVLSVLACGTKTTATPTATLLPPVVNSPVPPSGDLIITSTNAFVDSYGTYRVVGEVMNNGSKPLTSMELTLEIKDAAGTSILQDENGNSTQNTVIYPMLYSLAPGEYSPFEYSYDTTKGSPGSYNVTVTGYQTGEVNRAPVKSENVQLVDDGNGYYYLTGELVNTGSQWAHISSLAGAGLDDSNSLLSTDWTATYATELAPAGDTAARDRTPFEINFPDPGGVTQWALYIEADLADNVTDYPMNVSVTNTYFDQYGSAHIVGWLTNNSDQLLTSLVVAGVYASDGTTLDASYSFVPLPIKAGLQAPFHISSFGSVNYNQTQASRISTYTVIPDTWFTSTSSNEYVDLLAPGQTIQKDGATWTFSGSVTNTSGKSLYSITLVALVMDSQNKLMAMEYTTVYSSGDAIAAGDSNDYSITVYLDPNADVSGYTTTTLIIGEVK